MEEIKKINWEFNSSLCPLGEEPAWVALGQLHRSRVAPEEGNGKPLLSILYLEHPRKGCHESQLIRHTIIVIKLQ